MLLQGATLVARAGRANRQFLGMFSGAVFAGVRLDEAPSESR